MYPNILFYYNQIEVANILNLIYYRPRRKQLIDLEVERQDLSENNFLKRKGPHNNRSILSNLSISRILKVPIKLRAKKVTERQPRTGVREDFGDHREKRRQQPYRRRRPRREKANF